MKKVLFAILLSIICNLYLIPKSSASIVINSYAAVLSTGPCNGLNVDSTNGFDVGDTVLMIQMKGATIDLTNTASFGTVLNYSNCGNYEYNVVSAITGNTIHLKYNIVRTYDIPTGKVQLVKLPSYQNYTVSQTHTCTPWNGSKGGVFAIYVTNTLTLNDTISVNGAGFSGGLSDQNPTLRSNACVSSSMPLDYATAPNYDNSNDKGEGISEVPVNKSFGIAKAANGGGSGFSQNSGGGGGSNGNIGGQGGNEYFGCVSTGAANLKGGYGGVQLGYSNTANKIFMGGGGGSGHVNNINLSNGGNGGGICIITAGTITGSSKYISANGNGGLECVFDPNVFGSCHDGMAGGGGGGVILLNVNSATGTIFSEAKGGKGANENGANYNYQVGPGGGGGGGVVWIKGGTLPAALSVSAAGGPNGIVAYNNETWGAQPGLSGQTLTGLVLNFPTILFPGGSPPPQFTFTRTNCLTFNFQGASNSGPASFYAWSFGDGTTSSLQNPSHTFATYGSYDITLFLGTATGCDASTDSIITIPYFHFLNATGDTTVCNNIPVQLHATGAVSYAWLPATGLDTPSAANPIATVNTSTTYEVTGTDTFGCIDTNSVKVSIEEGSSAEISPSNAKLCGEGSVQLIVSGIDSVAWSPASSLNNSTIKNPVATPNATTTYVATGKNDAGCTISDSVTISVFSIPEIKIITDQDTINCTEPFAKLSATGAISYTWLPADILSNPNIQNPIATVTKPVEIFVTGVDENGCRNTDSLYLFISDNKFFFVPSAFSPNGDGLNDEFLPKYQCDLTLENFSVYNRFGQRIFFTLNKYKGWNGLQNSKLADMGTYYWYIEGVDHNHQKISKKGDVTLIR
jgi:gliding motility-associated-like protein